MPKVVGISLVRNEDIFITQSITNIANFCDKIIILDNLSTDNTVERIEQLKKTFSHIETYRINDYRQSHSYIADYAGTDTWVFGVDGDEIYDPIGLARFREQLRNGCFERHWAIFGNVVHCVQLDAHRNCAKGYLSPPSRSMTKFFNFSVLQSWNGQCERLHGGEKRFRTGFNEAQRLALNEQFSWDEAFFRCLHLCFIRRSTKEDGGAMSRLQPDEKPEWLKKLDRAGLGTLFDGVIQGVRSPWKDGKYRRGDLRVVDTRQFFSRVDAAELLRE